MVERICVKQEYLSALGRLLHSGELELSLKSLTVSSLLKLALDAKGGKGEEMKQ